MNPSKQYFLSLTSIDCKCRPLASTMRAFVFANLLIIANTGKTHNSQ